MEFTLADGSIVQVTAAASRALHEATPIPQLPGVLCLRSHTPGEAVRSLADQGLATRDRRVRNLVLTQRGIGLRDLLARTPGAVADDMPRRLSVHPEVPEGTAQRLAEAHRAGPRYRPSRPPARRRSGAGQGLWVLLGVCGAGTAGLTALAAIGGIAVVFLVVVTGAVVGGAAALRGIAASVSGTTRQGPALELTDRAREDDALLREMGDWYVAPAMLDTPARALLARAQAAVDSVLASSLHNQGLLLDTVRNRVVLADVEWGLADSLRGHTRTRRTMASTPTPGEHSRRAAARAREALEEDAARVEARVRVLEDYAGKVREAEMERYDRQAAARLDALAVEAGTGHTQQDDALSALVQAQELALRLASLTGDGLDGPAPEEGR
ncbi:hypothetical protein [Nocardiopsis sp. CNT312]|uniref:hypothetical protein n=1 Tax=Nocardiopsis sp. CNT312 TaxID=1137268 RepID=UPI0004AD6249|nr:hypothetical protein [Nocardiopsis sp. CNT312]